MESLEVQIAKLNETIRAKDAVIAQLTESVNSGKLATAKAERSAKLTESKLPEPSVNRIQEAFAKSADNAGLQEAINTEVKYVQSLGIVLKETVKRNNGAGDPIQEGDKSMEQMQESQVKAYVASGFSESVARSMAGLPPKK